MRFTVEAMENFCGKKMIFFAFHDGEDCRPMIISLYDLPTYKGKHVIYRLYTEFIGEHRPDWIYGKDVDPKQVYIKWEEE